MSSRMDRFYEAETQSSSRVSRNENLYKEIGKNEINNFEVKSNATVIGDNESNIDVEKIKKILDTRYNQAPQRQSIRIEEANEKEELEEKEPTKEYDINVILEKAREQKDVNYEEERLKKLRDTQFNILKNLDLEKNDSSKENEEDDENLKSLINTIYSNENDSNDANDNEEETSSSPLDILSDLRGDDDSEIYEGMDIELNKEIEKEEEKPKMVDMVDSFYTHSNVINKRDLDDSEEDEEDFTKEMESNNIFMKIVIVLIVLIFLIGVYLVIKSLFL